MKKIKMQAKPKMVLSNFFMIAFIILGSCYQNIASAKNWTPVTPPAVVEAFSNSFPDVEPSKFSKILEMHSHSEIRHVSISVVVNFSSTDGQWVDILATQPSGGDFIIKRFSNGNGTQQYETVEFNASQWYLRAFNNNAVNDEPILIDYQATTLFTP